MDDDGERGIEAFDPGSSEYKAYGRADNLTLPSLRLILKDGSEKACLYSQLDSSCPRDGCEFLPSSVAGTGTSSGCASQAIAPCSWSSSRACACGGSGS